MLLLFWYFGHVICMTIQSKPPPLLLVPLARLLQVQCNSPSPVFLWFFSNIALWEPGHTYRTDKVFAFRPYTVYHSELNLFSSRTNRPRPTVTAVTRCIATINNVVKAVSLKNKILTYNSHWYLLSMIFLPNKFLWSGDRCNHLCHTSGYSTNFNCRAQTQCCILS